jgi:hypothetical protein
VLIFVLAVGLPAAAAGADGGSRCYPPPCSDSATVLLGTGAAVSGPTPVVGLAPTTADDRSPAPFVGLGLASVVGALAAVGLRRRHHIARRDRPDQPVRSLRYVRRGVTTARKEPQAALR